MEEKDSSSCYNKFVNSTINKAVLEHTENGYKKTLQAYDMFVLSDSVLGVILQILILMRYRFRVKYPHTPYPPDLQAYKAFIAAVSGSMNDRVHEEPLSDTLDGFRRKFETAWKSPDL